MKRRIFIIADSDPRTKPMGGIGVYSARLAKLLAKTNKVVFIGKRQAVDPMNDVPYKVELADYKEGGNNISFIKGLFRIAKTTNFRNEDVIHVQRPDWIIPFRNTEAKKVITLHGSHRKNLRLKKGALISKAYGLAEKKSFKIADKIIAVDQETAKEYSDSYTRWREKIIVIPVGVDAKKFNPRKAPGEPAEALDGISNVNVAIGTGSDKKKIIISGTKKTARIKVSSDKILLFVGRLSKEKRVERMISSIRDDELLLIIGEGKEESKLRRLAAGKNVLFLGRKTQDELPPFYRLARATLIFSEHEGLPITALESLACGTPMVTTKVGELQNIITPKEGVQVRGDDYRSAIDEILSKPKEQYLSNCRKLALKFDWNKIVSKIEGVYD